MENRKEDRRNKNGNQERGSEASPEDRERGKNPLKAQWHFDNLSRIPRLELCVPAVYRLVYHVRWHHAPINVKIEMIT